MPDDPGDKHQDGAGRSGSDDDPAGRLIAGRYRLLGRLGSGAMADVYRAHDETLDRDVAVKLFRAVMDDADTAGRSRQELELQALAQLSHPNLITLFDGSVSDSATDGPAFLALELVEGPTLAAALSSGALPEPRVRQIGAQIAGALAYIHERGMVHRDVKPANILLGSDGLGDPAAVRARLSDFGIVRLVDETAPVTAADLTVGTAYYLAPEQARSAAVGPEADVYALGLVLVEALIGARAFEGPLREVLIARLNRDPHIPADLPEPWPALLTSMTASDPACRPSAADVARTLHASPASGAPAIVGAAGFAGGLAGQTAAADAAATPAAATARTSALPRTGGPLIVPPLASFPANRSPQSEPESGRHKLAGLTIAAAVVVAITVGAGWLLLRPSGHAMPQQQQLGTTAGTSSAAPTTGHPRPAGNRHHAARPAPTQPINRTFSHKRTARSPAHSSSRPGPTTPASTASVPSTSAPPTGPRTTSSPPSTSAAPGTSDTASAGGTAGSSPGSQRTVPGGAQSSSAATRSAIDVAQQQPVSAAG